MTEEEIREELERSGITYGISDKIIRAYLKGRQFCRDIPIARGEAVIQGQNARIVQSMLLLLPRHLLQYHQKPLP